MNKIQIIAKSGYTWEEDVEDIDQAVDSIIDEHDDIMEINDITDRNIEQVYYNN